jgi:hypothetical protein
LRFWGIALSMTDDTQFALNVLHWLAGTLRD